MFSEEERNAFWKNWPSGLGKSEGCFARTAANAGQPPPWRQPMDWNGRYFTFRPLRIPSRRYPHWRRILWAVRCKGCFERNYRDYRRDETLGVRQFEIALRRLRQFSTRVDGVKDQLDLEETINETCRNAGRLKLVWTRPRKNAVKVIVLMDSGGSMYRYADICSQLFAAVHKASHFKDLQFYYFHNCIYDHLYLDASCNPRRTVKTADIMQACDAEYKMILIGDAAMAPSELLMIDGIIYWDMSNDEPGIAWLQRLAKRFPYNVWLNPIPEAHWETTYGRQTIQMVREIFPMVELTLDGLDKAIKKLMVRK
jgi:uncharacterized protein with von Willebrand factor type A (vWA) domain